jgi:hypothetical protein
MCEANSWICGSVRGSRESLDRTFSVIRTTLFLLVFTATALDISKDSEIRELIEFSLESLILAQDERWRRA